MDYAQKAVWGTVTVFLLSILSNALGYILRIILARNLTVAEYGLFYAVFGLVSFLLFFRDLGLNAALIKYIAEWNVQKKFDSIKTAIISVFSWQLLISCLFAGGLFLFSDFLGTSYFKNPAAHLLLKYFFIYIIISSIAVFVKSVLIGFQKISIATSAEILRLSAVIITVLLLFNKKVTVFAPLYAFIFGWVIVVLFLLPFMFKTFSFLKYCVRDSHKTTKMLFSFGLPVMLTSIGSRVIAQLDTLLLTYFGTLEQVGIYNVILPSSLLFLFASGSISIVLFPLISELQARGDKKRITECCQLLQKYIFVAIVPAMLAVFVFADLFLSIFFGPAYVVGKQAFQILLIGVIVFSVSKINHDMISALGKPKQVTSIIAIAAVINFIANIILIPLYGIEGAAVATSISYLAALILSSIALSKIIDIAVPWFSWLRIFLAGGFFVLIIHYMRKLLILNIWTEMIITVVCASIVYILLLIVMKIIDIQELKTYSNIILTKRK